MSKHLTLEQAAQGIADIMLAMDDRIAGKAFELCREQDKPECYACVCNSVLSGKMAWLAQYTAKHPPPETDQEELAFFVDWDTHCVSAAKEFLKLPCTMKQTVMPENKNVH